MTIPQFNALTVSLDAGVTLVEASAGTGKTFAITRLVLRFLLERRVERLSQLLVVTFTERATQELVTRIRIALREAHDVFRGVITEQTPANAELFTLAATHDSAGAAILAGALAELDGLSVSTIHGFCQRLLRESALESRVAFASTLLEHPGIPLGRAVRDWTRARVVPAPSAAALLGKDDPVGWMRSLLTPTLRAPDRKIALPADPATEAPALLADYVERASEAFHEHKRARHLFEFDDLLQQVHRILKEEGSDGALAQHVRQRYRAALIDEFQDTDPVQFPIFATAFTGCPLFLIGDPKQSIYGFRGADINSYLEAAAGAARRYTLMENYRSVAPLVAAVEALFTRVDEPFCYPRVRIDYPKVRAAQSAAPPAALAVRTQGAFVWQWFGPDLAPENARPKHTINKTLGLAMVVRETVQEIARLNADGLPLGSIAVLVRKNQEGEAMRKALVAAGLPAVVNGTEDVLESDEALELARIALAVAEPKNGAALRSALATRLWGASFAEVAATVDDATSRALEELSEQCVRARDLWALRGPAPALAELLHRRGSAPRILAASEGERRWTNVRHCLELLQDAWREDAIPPDAIPSWMAAECEQAAPERRELRLESDASAVQVLTIHKAKGLQWPVVFCPTLWTGPFESKEILDVEWVHLRENGTPVLDLGSEKLGERRSARTFEDRAEQQRLAYVALTRAQFRCYVAWGVFNKAVDSPLAHLMGAPDRDALRAFVATEKKTMTMVEAPTRVAPSTAPVAAGATSLLPPRTLPALTGRFHTWRSTSFTSITRDSHGWEGRELDDPVALLPAAARPADVPGFRGFVAGTEAGNALHALFETHDFRTAPTEEAVRAVLEEHNITPPKDGRWSVADVVAMVERTCAATIPDSTLSLARIAPDSTLREWRFALPVGGARPRDLAHALSTHGSAVAQAYAPRLAALKDDDLTGYLNGSIDLALRDDGRWWIIDWKSNWLGAADTDYERAPVEAAMIESHYVLQYHLYALALHRYLRTRQRDYDPATHWGGVAYVFLRGVDGTSERGWFRDCPSPALLDALDAAVAAR
ncbi:MAG: UvrD-helicase domain-containing protein [Gemmatimonadaceae bacterium]|nr:UvrD-helicase domain-containing protein [Gemmatimonadaceae bacterium]